jgi:dTDP-4-dehydrorhamnose reductase
MTKYQGECAVEKYLEKYFIVRISWAFGKNGNNFVKTMLNLGKKYDKITVVDDQIGSPTYTFDLSVLLVDMIESNKYGRYHATNEGLCSWYDFACEIFKEAGEINPIYKKVQVSPVDSSAYPSKAKRPSNSRMSKDKLSENGFKKLPVWQDALKRYLKEIEV